MESSLVDAAPPSRASAAPSPSAPATPAPLGELLALTAAGDETAFRAFYDALAPRVLGLALRVLRDRAAAEEAALDVFAQIWRQAGRYDPAKAGVATWVTTLARTRAIDLARIHRRRRHAEIDVDPELRDALPDEAADPVLRAVEDDHADLVRAALTSLPREQREAVELAFFSGYTHTEVAAVLRAPLGTVKTRIRTGLITLRTTLASVEGSL